MSFGITTTTLSYLNQHLPDLCTRGCREYRAELLLEKNDLEGELVFGFPASPNDLSPTDESLVRAN
jgi:hypothetical protein